MRLSGSVKFFCALGSGSSEGGAAGFPGFLRPSAFRFSSASARALASAAAGRPPPPDLLGPLLLVGDPVRHLIAALVAAERLVLPRVRRFGSAHPLGDLGVEFRRPLGHALVAHRLVFRGVRLDLRSVERDMPELRQPGPFAQLQNLGEQAGERLQVSLAEIRDGAEIRCVEADDAHEVDPFARRLGDPARRVDPVAISVKQQRRHHRRIKRRLSARAPIGSLDLTKIKMPDHKRQHKARQVVLPHEVLHARRQQQRLIDRPRAESLAHKQAESNSRPGRHKNPPLLGQAPSFDFSSIFHRHGGRDHAAAIVAFEAALTVSPLVSHHLYPWQRHPRMDRKSPARD